MACDDRQLTEAQRQAGYQQGRTGVQQAIRPFSGRPTLDNLIDYINRELQPAVKRTRDKVNDVYLQVTDNAPSGNPLQYYFSTDTTNADPTAGRVRFDASPQDTATTIRVSESNARLVDARPWLEVMAGGATTPLGVVTLTDAINPARFVRFDLSSMVDQGAYWDLTVVAIESSHDDPFVEGGGLVISFIPGVASTGTTVPPGTLTPIGPNTVIGNPTTSTAAPIEIAIAANSVLGRAGVAGTGNIEAITVPGTGVDTGESVFLQSSSLRNHIRWDNLSLAALPIINDNSFVGNISGAPSRPIYTGLGLLSSVSVSYENVGKTLIREALSGDVVALQNNNTTTIQPNVVDDTKLRDSGALSVIGRAFNSTGDPADISAVAASDAVLRESGSALGFGTIATGGIADAAITNAKLANMLAGTVKGRQIDAGTGAPVDLVGTELAELIRLATRQSLALSATQNDLALNADTTVLRVTPSGGTQTLSGMSGGTDGRIVLIENIAGTGNVVSLPSLDAGSLTANRFRTPNGQPIALRFRETAIARWDSASNDWRIIATGRATVVGDADYGDITVTGSGLVWTIDNDVVSDAKLRNSVALSVIGRSANSTGDPADIAAANDAEVLRRSGTTLGFGTVATAGITDDAVTDAKIRNSAALSVIGRSANSTGDPADIAAANDGEVLRRSGTALGFGTLATAGLADNSVTDGKLRDSGALSVIGRSANSSGDPADISASAASGAVLRESGSALGFGTVATAGIADSAITNAKLANMTAGTVKGRQIDASTGVPVDLTGAEVVELLRWGTTQSASISAQQDDFALNADATVLRFTPSGTITVTGITGGVAGRLLIVENVAGSGNNVVLASLSASSSTANRLRTPRALDLTLGFRESVILRWDGSNGDWRVLFVGVPLSDGDKGDITLTSGATVWTIDNDVVTDAKLRNSAALSVIGRSANSTGDPADIAAANDAEVLRRSGTTLGFGTVATAGIADDAVSNAKLRNSGALSVIGRSANSTGDPGDIATTSGSNGVLVESGGTLSFGLVTTLNILDNTIADADLRQSGALSVVGRTFNTTGNVADISATAASDAVLRESGSTLSFGQIATGGIANDAVTDGKLRNGGALSVIGRSANSTGDVADISGTASSDQVLRVSGTTLGFGTVATAGIADAAVTLAKLASLAQSRVIGRAEGAGTGVPTALTPTEVASIIDGETVTWTGSHTFSGTNVTFSGTNVTASTSNDITLGAGATTTISGGTVVQITSPTRLASSVRLDAVTSTAGTAANDLAIGVVNVVRFTGGMDPLTGMVAVSDGQTVLLVNAHASTNMGVHIESGSSSAANRFAGLGTSRVIRPGEMALAWYDGASDRWRLLLRDEVDL